MCPLMSDVAMFVVRDGQRVPVQPEHFGPERPMRILKIDRATGPDGQDLPPEPAGGARKPAAGPQGASGAQKPQAGAQAQGGAEMPAGSQDAAAAKAQAEEPTAEERLQTPEGLLQFFSDPMNAEGWAMPVVVEMATKFLAFVERGKVDASAADMAVACAERYAEVAPQLKALDLLPGKDAKAEAKEGAEVPAEEGGEEAPPEEVAKFAENVPAPETDERKKHHRAHHDPDSLMARTGARWDPSNNDSGPDDDPIDLGGGEAPADAGSASAEGEGGDEDDDGGDAGDGGE